MGNLFGTKNETKTSQTSEQSGRTESNFLPQLQDAYGRLQSQYANLGSMGANPYQTGAADAQMGVAGNLQPAYGAAGQVAQGGIGDPSRFMSPYIQSVVDATRADFAAQNARDLSNVGGQAAKLNAVTGTGRTAALQQAREAQSRTQDPIIASLFNQGFQQSGQLAQADASARLAGANSIGSLVGANTQANTGLGSIGTQVQQANLSPYALANQYASGVAGLAGQAGNNYTGQSSGQGTSTQTQSQGAGTIAAGLLGSALMGGFNPFSFLNGPPGGGEPQGGSGKASGGAVTGDADGNGIMDRYEKTLASLHRMHGGSIPGMAYGGAVNNDLPRFQDAGRVNEQTTNIEPRPQVGMPYSAPEPEMPRMDLGGPSAQPQSSGYDWSGLIPTFSDGVWRGEKPTGMQTLGYALTQIGKDNPFAGFGSAAFGQYNKEEERRRQRDELAKRLAMDSQRLAQERALATGIGMDGKPTVSLQQLQEMVRHHQAQEGQTRFSPLPEKSRGVLDTRTGQITGTPTEDRAQDRFNENYAKEHAPKNYDTAVNEYAVAAESAENIRSMQKLAPYAQTGYTGPIPPEAMLTARKMAASVGLTNADSIAPTELFKFLAQKGVFNLTSQLKPASNLDMIASEKATASMQTDPRTLPIALPVLLRVEERKMAYREAMMDFYRKGVAPSKDDIVGVINRLNEKLPLLNIEGVPGQYNGAPGGPRTDKPVTDRLGQSQTPRSPPDQAVSELLANAGNPAYIASFNKHFNGGRPGLAESIIQNRPADSIPLGVP